LEKAFLRNCLKKNDKVCSKKAKGIDFKALLSYGTVEAAKRWGLFIIEILKDKGYELNIGRAGEGNHSWV
jgi:hypothetical protein